MAIDSSLKAIEQAKANGRHLEIEKESLARISKALIKNGKLFIDGGSHLKEIKLKKTE